VKRLIVMATIAGLAVTCGGTTEPREDQPSITDEEQNELVDNTREVAELLCGETKPEAIAREYGVPADDFDAIARAYSMDSTEGPHRDAAYAGCLKGLTER
jgi:hypothetical protein